jgi:ribosomal protein S18 acetylase RimI-like enzyme
MSNIRPMHLPKDIDVYLHLLREGFQYADNPDWSLQRDEIEYIIDSLNLIKRLWPIIWVLRIFSADMRDMMYGFIAEEDGQTVGIITGQRRRGSKEWYGTNLVVLPPFRRRGIAQQLANAALEYVRTREAPIAILDVVDGNLPAYNIYKEMGFEDYSGYVDFSFDQTPPKAVLPAGYNISSLPTYDWRIRYEMDQRITPEIVKKYTPLSETNYRRPWFMITFLELGRFLTRKKDETLVVRSQETQQVVAIASYHARTRPGGINSLKIRLDPAHPVIAPFLIAHMLECIHKAGQGQRVKFQFPTWQPALIAAAEALGAKKLSATRRMGMNFK